MSTLPSERAVLSPNTRLSRVIELHPDVLQYVVSLAPHALEQLHNPLLQKVMLRHITLDIVAAVVGLPVNTLLERLAKIIGANATVSDEVALPQSPKT